MEFFGPASGTRLRLAVVNGETGIIATRGGRAVAVIVLTARDELVTAIYAIADGKKLTRIQVLR